MFPRIQKYKNDDSLESRGYDFVGRGWSMPVVEVPVNVEIPNPPVPFIVPVGFCDPGQEYSRHALREFDLEITARDNDPPRYVVEAIIRAEFGPKIRRLRAKTREENYATRKRKAAAKK